MDAVADVLPADFIRCFAKKLLAGIVCEELYDFFKS